MPNHDLPPTLMPSVLDRLIDPNSGGTSSRRGYTADQMMTAVKRDLEELLNTRQSHTGLSPDFVEVHRSLIGYGLPDLTSLNAISPEQRDDIGHVLEQVVSTFEPRLRDVHAFVVESGGGAGFERTVRFRLEARLNVDPAPEVAFDTILELTTGHYSIQSTAT
jgi:type VI secretion system protein ImpF